MVKNLKEETIFLIKEIYKIHSAGGWLHIVLDDENIEDDNILYCLNSAIPLIENLEERKLYENCANNLLKMTEKQRRKCIEQAMRGKL